MKYELMYRYGRNDAWSIERLRSFEDLKEEIVYKALHGAEVMVSSEVSNELEEHNLI